MIEPRAQKFSDNLYLLRCLTQKTPSNLSIAFKVVPWKDYTSEIRIQSYVFLLENVAKDFQSVVAKLIPISFKSKVGLRLLLRNWSLTCIPLKLRKDVVIKAAFQRVIVKAKEEYPDDVQKYLTPTNPSYESQIKIHPLNYIGHIQFWGIDIDRRFDLYKRALQIAKQATFLAPEDKLEKSVLFDAWGYVPEKWRSGLAMQLIKKDQWLLSEVPEAARNYLVVKAFLENKPDVEQKLNEANVVRVSMKPQTIRQCLTKTKTHLLTEVVFECFSPEQAYAIGALALQKSRLEELSMVWAKIPEKYRKEVGVILKDWPKCALHPDLRNINFEMESKKKSRRDNCSAFSGGNQALHIYFAATAFRKTLSAKGSFW